MRIASRSPYVTLLFTVGLIAVLIGMVMFLLPRLGASEDLSTLVTLMLVIAALAVGGAYIAYRLRLIRWLRSLRWALLVTMILTVVLIFLNVWVTAHLMFIS